jgi:hypothetical protein
VHVVQYFVIVFVAAKVMVMVGLELGVGVPARSFLVDGQTETSEFESVDRQTKDIIWRERAAERAGSLFVCGKNSSSHRISISFCFGRRRMS